MKNHFIVIEVEENSKYYSYMIKATKNHNLIKLLDISNIITATIYPTKKEAMYQTEELRRKYIRNNEYMFQDPMF